MLSVAERQKLLAEYTILEKSIIEKIVDNEELMDLFLDWQVVRLKLNEDAVEFYTKLLDG